MSKQDSDYITNKKKEISITSHEALKDLLDEIKKVSSNRELYYNESAFKELEKIKDDAELQTKLKSVFEEKVTVLGIKLEYPKFFTCFRAHDLNDLLKRNEIFTGIIDFKKEK